MQLNARRQLLAFLFFVAHAISVDCFEAFQNLIPNGRIVPNPCSEGDIWKGVGHEDPNGGGNLNQFGNDFNSEGNRWTYFFCSQDSDGDGVTNGEELGDPFCMWETGLSPMRTTNITNPAICEPVGSSECQNNDLGCGIDYGGGGDGSPSEEVSEYEENAREETNNDNYDDFVDIRGNWGYGLYYIVYDGANVIQQTQVVRRLRQPRGRRYGNVITANANPTHLTSMTILASLSVTIFLTFIKF